MSNRSACIVLLALFNGFAFAQSGSDAPDFTQTDSEGKEVKLSALKGKPVLILFYADDCAECRDVVQKTLEQLKQYGNEKKEIVSIGFLYRRDGAFMETQRKKHKDTNGVTFTHYISFPADFGPIYKSYQHVATKKKKDPYVVAVVNKEGKIVLCQRGTIEGVEDALKTVAK